MVFILELSKEDLELSVYEARRLLGVKGKLVENLLLVEDVDVDLVKRLAYVNNLYELVVQCYMKDFEKSLKGIGKFYEKSYCVRKIGDGLSEKEIGSLFWDRLVEVGLKPKVDLFKPKTLFVCIFFKNNVIVGKLIWGNEKEFLNRKAHKRPALHPSSLNPRLAKAMVNISAKNNICDPFCGSGGILIEAGLMGLKVEGCDINRFMINACEKNLKHFGVKCKLMRKDALKLIGKFGAIVTDLPYAKNTKNVDLDKLYKEFFKNVYSLTDVIVVGLPDFVSLKGLLYRWKVKKKFVYYLHKSLSKVILVLEKS